MKFCVYPKYYQRDHKMPTCKFINCTSFAVSVLGWHDDVRRGVRVGSYEEALLRSDMAGWSIDTWSKTTNKEHSEWMSKFDWKTTASSIANFFPCTMISDASESSCKEVKIEIAVDGEITVYTLMLSEEPMTKSAERTTG
jgi:hypothetical protein